MAQPKLRWGGFSNGQIPRSSLVDIGGGKLLQADAADTWQQFAAAFRAEWGGALYLADYQDAYRDLARQQAMLDRYEATGLPRNGVARPGSSVHGWARSVDCSGYGADGSLRHLWMQRNAGRFGWSWAYGRELNESWHWDYTGPITTIAGDGYEPVENPTVIPPAEGNLMTQVLKCEIPTTIPPAALAELNGYVGGGSIDPGEWVFAFIGDAPGTRANVQLTQLDARGNEWAADHTGELRADRDGVDLKKGARLYILDEFLALLRAYSSPLAVAAVGNGDGDPTVLEAITAAKKDVIKRIDAIPTEYVTTPKA